MTGRRALGDLVQRAARGAGLAARDAAWWSAATSSASGALSGEAVARGLSTGYGASTSDPAATRWVGPGPSPSTGRSTANHAPPSAPSTAVRGMTTFAASAPPSDPSLASPSAAAPDPSAAAPDPSAERLLLHRAQLTDRLCGCLSVQQLDAVLARDEDRDAFDELLLLTALDAAHRLLAASSSSSSLPLTAASLALAARAGPGFKSAAECGADVLTRLSELLIRLLAEPGMLSPEGAVRALRTLSTLRFNPAGDYAGLMTMAAFYRETVLPALNPAAAAPTDPTDPTNLTATALAAKAPALLVDLFFAFSRLFEVAVRNERELRQKLMAEELAREHEALRREEDAEAADDKERARAAATAARERAQAAAAAGGSAPALAPGSALGDRQLYYDIAALLADEGRLAGLPSRTLGQLASAMQAAAFAPYPLPQNLVAVISTRLQGVAAGGAPANPDAGASHGDIHPSTLCNILLSLSKLGHDGGQLCDSAANWMLQRMHGGAQRVGGGRLEPHHVTEAATAFTRMGYDNQDFFQRASDELRSRVATATPNTAAMFTWALANQRNARGLPDLDPTLEALSRRMTDLLRRNMAARGGAHQPGPDGGEAQPGPGPSYAAPTAAVIPRHVGCIVYAQARLGFKDDLLLSAVAADVRARADKYSARQLSNLLRGFTQLDAYQQAMYDTACDVLSYRVSATRGLSHADLSAAPPDPAFALGPQHYADTAWALALAGHAHRAEGLMTMLAERVAETAVEMGHACRIRAAQAFAVARLPDPGLQARVFDALAQASLNRVSDLGPTYLARLVDAFADTQHPVSEAFWLQCMEAAGLKLGHLERNRRDMEIAAQRLLDAFNRHPATQTYDKCRNHFILGLLQRLTARAAQHE
ncbi:hypothetical protein HYH03_011656 [Edaphochlamys debaryana]|uniref:Uncharacterized protein n=1 Tax=Edaphochlamys debaryana TaxID=47281 RepID=A0A836BW78_9CHLO|nr:hypothetical protein HYH03_011656 [Edaphochlamys debaryana]|eukprot:KAG2489853.1 hypothetical protein HYH03_011656 [Edaphochlamys debaryana]